MVAALWAAALWFWQTHAETVRGVLLESAWADSHGEISVRAPDHRVHVFLLDAGTLIQRHDQAVEPRSLTAGDAVEVICDADDRGLRRYARAVLVTAPARPRPPLPTWRDWGPADAGGLFPRGRITFAGIVTAVAAGRLYLRTRNQGRQVLLLREDTQFRGDGLPCEPEALRVNMHVFVRAGRSLEGELEAFQIVWGRILRAP